MRNLSTSDLLDLWERGYSLHPLDRAVLILHTALPEAFESGVADWPLGRRNTRLAAVRNACFGPRLEGWAVCRQCGEKLEFDVDGRMFAEHAEDEVGTQAEPVTVAGRSFRLPSTRDLARLIHEQDAPTAALHLIESCSLEPGEPLTHEQLDLLSEKMSRADPMAEILLDMLCPACGYEGFATLDLIAFFWAELEVRAKRLLLDIHHLASAYGWSEARILALSDHRRAFYLDLVQA